MGLIIDNNVAADFVNQPGNPNHAPIYDWVIAKGGKIAIGGRLKKELEKNLKMHRLLYEWRVAGRVIS